MVRYYVNLTAGLEHLFRDTIKTYGNVVFVHILSSHIEQKAWDKFFYTLPDDLLLHLALGTNCVILDASSNKNGESKVIRIGIPVIKHILYKLWFNVSYYPLGIDKDYLVRIYKMLSKTTKQKIRYYKDFLNTKHINLAGIGLRLLKEDGNLTIQKFKKEFGNVYS